MVLPWPIERASRIAGLAGGWGRGTAGELTSLVRACLAYPVGAPGLAASAADPWPRGVPRVGDVATPVLMVHGAGHNATAWRSLAARLHGAGFVHLATYGYRLRGQHIEDLAKEIAVRVDGLRDRAGTERVHVVGHSLGGVALRVWHDLHGGAPAIASATTLGSPHRGRRFVGLPGVLPSIAQLAEGSDLFAQLDDVTADRTRWTTVAGSMDLVVPSDVAHLPGATTIDVPGVGHLGLLYSRRVAGQVCFAALAAEDLLGRDPAQRVISHERTTMSSSADGSAR